MSCLPLNSKMSKVKKALDEAQEAQVRELDLVDKNVVSFDEMPALCEYLTVKQYIDDRIHSSIYRIAYDDCCVAIYEGNMALI